MLSNFPFEAVLWDMDGTLIDSEPLWIEQERLLMESIGADWTHEDGIRCVGGPMARVDAYMRSKLSIEQQTQYAPLELTNQLLVRMEARLAEGVPFTPGSFDLVTEMKVSNVPLALVSASSRPLMDAALKSIGRDLFDVTISDNDVQRSKPDPEGYLKAADALSVDISRSLVIEDSITGVTAAIASGAFVIGLPHVAQLPLGEKVIHHPTLEGLDMNGIAKIFALADGRK
ncbi:MAG: HAD family hydrolase [Holophagaceae bacterium]